MSKYRLLSLLLAIVMMFSCVSTQQVTAYAIGNPTFTVSSGTGNPGEDVTLMVDISNNPGICTATIWVHYDEGLKLKSASDSRLLVGGLFGGDKTANPYGLGWDDSANFDGDNNSNGTLATLVFTIDSSAAAGDYDVWITYNYGDIYNLDFDDFDFECVAGKITVKGTACEHKNTEIRDAVTESCNTAGYTGDTWCKDCNTKIADGQSIPANGNHVDADNEWESNGTQHFHTCACGTEFDKTNHSGGTATCKVQANCSVCGTAYGDLNNKNHANTEVRDAVTESCNETGYTGDTWCKDCETKIADGESIPATGNHIDADGKWESDGRQHFRTCSCGTKFDFADHTGGTATCNEKAVCTVCNIAYGSLDSSNHIGGTHLVGQKETSCYEEGYTGDTYCSSCNTKIADGQSIPTSDHSPVSVWSTDDTYHWHECEVIACGNIVDKAQHSGGTATCSVKAICSVCNVAYGSFDSKKHVNTEVRDAVTESCNTAGYTGDTWCKDCETKIADGDVIPATGNHIDADGKWESNGTQHYHTCGCGTKFDYTNHSGGTATCKVQANCSVCETAYGELNNKNHVNTEIRDAATESCNEAGYTGDTWCKDCETKIADGDVIPATGNHVDADGKWESDGTQHFHTCSCGTKFDYTNHSGGIATCRDKAICSVCETAYGDLNNKNHVGGTHLVGQKETSCYEEGYTGDTYCSGCNTKIADGQAISTSDHSPASVWSTDDTYHWHECEVIACGNIVDKAEHSGGEATCKNKAVCSVCNVAYGSLNNKNHKNIEIRDAVTESCNTVGYTGDTWCKDCETKIADGQTIPATGNHDDADNKWESNETQHFHTCSCGVEFDKTNHSGGTATCKEQANCSVCGTAYGELNNKNHVNTEIRDVATESCNTAGYTGDTWCKDCETKIADGQTIPATGNHVDSDNKWESNGTQHFHTCSCGTEFDKADHTGGTASCKEQANCAVCETAYGELNDQNHVGGTYLVGQKETSCYEEGYTGNTYCSGCNAKIADGQTIPTSEHNPTSVWSTDDTHHWHECEVIACGNIVDKAEHNGGTATCSAKAVCSVCNVAYGSLDSNKHANTEIRDAVEMSCEKAGYTGDTWCKDCETKIADGDVIPAAHKTTKVPTVNATHFENGNIEYFACSNCEKLFADETATTEIKLEDTVVVKGEHSYGEEYEKDADNHWKQCGCGNMIEKSAHTFGEWATIKEATKSEKGSKEKTCSVCGYKVTEEILVVEGDDKEDIPNTDPNSPQTGDTSNLPLWIALLIVSGCCLTVCTVSNRRKKHNR